MRYRAERRELAKPHQRQPFWVGRAFDRLLVVGQRDRAANRYSDATTNLVACEQYGGTIGDAMIWAVGVTIESLE